MSDKKPSVILIGPGTQGMLYKSFVEEAGAEVTSVGSRSEATAKAAATEIGIPPEHYHWGEDSYFETPIFRERGLVVVATPGSVRRPLELAFRLGKNVFCENPLADTHECAKSLCELYEKAKAKNPSLQCTVNEQWIWLPGVKELFKQIMSGCVGKILRVYIGGKGRAFEEDLTRIGSHLFSVAIHRFTGPVKYVDAGRPDQSSDCRAGQIFCATKSGIPIIADFYPYGRNSRRCFIEIHGTKGLIRASGSMLEEVRFCTANAFSRRMDRLPMGANTWQVRNGLDEEQKSLQDPKMNPSYCFFRQFLLACNGKAQNPYPPHMFLPVAAAVDAIKTSVQTGSFVFAEQSC